MDPQADVRDALGMLDAYLAAARSITTRDAKAAIGRLKSLLPAIEKGRSPETGKFALRIREQIRLAEEAINERSAD